MIDNGLDDREARAAKALPAVPEEKEKVETPVDARASADQYAADASKRAGSSRVRVNDMRQTIEQKRILGINTANEEKELNRLEIEAARDEVFSKEFAGALSEVMDIEFKTEDGQSYRLRDVVDRHLESIRDASPDELAERQKVFVRELVWKMRGIPGGDWSLSMRQTLETKSANCSAAASILSSVLESVQGITHIPKVEYVNPRGHAMNMVRFSDGRLFYTDPRNRVFEDITDKVDIEERDDMTVYALREGTPQMPHHFYPALRVTSDIVVGNYAANMSEVPAAARGEFSEELMLVATPEQRAKMQVEAAEAQKREGLTDDDAVRMSRLSDELEKPIREIRRSPEFKVEDELFKQIDASGKEVERMDARLQKEPELMARLAGAKAELRLFLLNQSDEIDIGYPDVEDILRRYREARQKAHIIVHKSSSDVEREVDDLLEKIR